MFFEPVVCCIVLTSSLPVQESAITEKMAITGYVGRILGSKYVLRPGSSFRLELTSLNRFQNTYSLVVGQQKTVLEPYSIFVRQIHDEAAVKFADYVGDEELKKDFEPVTSALQRAHKLLQSVSHATQRAERSPTMPDFSLSEQDLIRPRELRREFDYSVEKADKNLEIKGRYAYQIAQLEKEVEDYGSDYNAVKTEMALAITHLKSSEYQAEGIMPDQAESITLNSTSVMDSASAASSLARIDLVPAKSQSYPYLGLMIDSLTDDSLYSNGVNFVKRNASPYTGFFALGFAHAFQSLPSRSTPFGVAAGLGPDFDGHLHFLAGATFGLDHDSNWSLFLGLSIASVQRYETGTSAIAHKVNKASLSIGIIRRIN